MKRLTTLIAPLLAVLGSLGLFVFGTAFGQFTFDVTQALNVQALYDAGQPPLIPKSLQELPLAVVSGMTFMSGLIFSSVTIAIRDHHRRISITSKRLHCSAGVTLMIAAAPLTWGIVIVRNVFSTLVNSASYNPTEIEAMLKPSESLLLTGYVLLTLTAALLFAAGVSELVRKATTLSDGASTGLIRVATIGSAFVGIVVLLLLISIWSSGNALVNMIPTISVTPDPTALGGNMMGILNRSFLAFAALAVLGLIYFLAALFRPHLRKDEVSQA